MRNSGLKRAQSLFRVIMYPTAQHMARNSRKLPKAGFGACSLLTEKRVSQNTPTTARPKPAQVRAVKCSLSTNLAATATISGRMATTMPAWEALV